MDLKSVEQAEAMLGCGRFQVSSLLQKRAQEIVRGAPPLVDTRSENPIEIALLELLDSRVTMDLFDAAAEQQELAEAALTLGDETLGDDDAGILDI